MAKVKELLDKGIRFADKNSPAILTGLAVAGVVATAISAYKAGPKVSRIMNDHRKEMERIEKIKDEEKFKKEKKEQLGITAKEVIPAILPPIVFGGITIACMISANRVSSRRIAAISAAYEIASRSLSDYKEKITEIVPKKADEIKEAVIKKHVQESEVPTDEDLIYQTGHGDVLCKDIYTGVFFRSSHAEIEKAINKMSAMVRDENYISVSDLYYELGVKAMPPIANDIGWSVDDCIEGNLPIMIVTCWDKTGTIPVIGLDYEVDPFYKEGGRFRGR